MNIGFEQIIQVFRMNGTSILVEYNKHSGRAEHAFLLNGTSILLKRSIYSGQNGPTFNITGLSVFYIILLVKQMRIFFCIFPMYLCFGAKEMILDGLGMQNVTM